MIQLTQGGTQFPVEEGNFGTYDLSQRIPVSQWRQLGTPWFHPLLNIFQVKSTFRPAVCYTFIFLKPRSGIRMQSTAEDYGEDEMTSEPTVVLGRVCCTETLSDAHYCYVMAVVQAVLYSNTGCDKSHLFKSPSTGRQDSFGYEYFCSNKRITFQGAKLKT